MKQFIHLIMAFCLICFSLDVKASENIFYLLHTKPSQVEALHQTLKIIRQNHRAIQILIPQAYRINKHGTVLGWLNLSLLSLAKNYDIKVMPMVTNAGYDPIEVHEFLLCPSAQKIAIQSLIKTVKYYHLYGVQFDFEGISIRDRETLTHFYSEAANAFHQENLKISFAVIPAFKTEMNQSIFLRKTYKNWAGAYDLKALAQFADFVTIMAYNQHPDGTIPGPTASVGFAEAAIKNALKEMPAAKISLGLPTYSLYWFSGYSSIALHQNEISFNDATKVIQKNHSQLFWNKHDKVNYAIYEHNWLNEYVYLEDVYSFKAKLKLIQKYKLRGFSVFRIGTEDKRIWGLLKNKTYV